MSKEVIALVSPVLLYGEINLICILTFGMLAWKVNGSMFLQSHRFYFRLVALSAIALFGSDFLWIFSENGYWLPSRSLNWLLNGVYYVCMTLLGYCWFLYSESVQNPTRAKSKGYLFLTALPLLLVTLLVLISTKTGWLFYIDEGNHYHRGPLFLLQSVICYGYIFATAIRAQKLSNETRDYYEKQNYRALASFVIIPSAAGVLQIAIPGMPLICAGITISMLHVYASLQENLISRDPLTKLNNRNQLHQYLSTQFHQVSEHHPQYLLIVDGDDFKKINDTYGHIEGDHALKEIAAALCRACKRKDFIARFGGDEFVILARPDVNEPISLLEKRIHAEMRNTKTTYPITVSIGTARLTKDIRTEQDLIALADQDLYRRKKEKVKAVGADLR